MARICNGRICWSCVDTRAYSPTQNIFAASWGWPKALCNSRKRGVRARPKISLIERFGM
jgi:hypothetical protein